LYHKFEAERHLPDVYKQHSGRSHKSTHDESAWKVSFILQELITYQMRGKYHTDRMGEYRWLKIAWNYKED